MTTFLNTFFAFAGATIGILIVVVPLTSISYLLYQFRIKMYLRKIRKKQEEEIQKQVDEMNRQIQSTEEFYG